MASLADNISGNIVVEIEVDIDNIYWPPKCAYCNAPATNTVTARCSAVKSVGYYVIVWTTKTREIAVNYPVCSSHRFKATVASMLSRRSMFYLGLGVLSVFALFSAAIWFFGTVVMGQYEALSGGQIAYLFVFPAVYWWLFFWAKKNAPMRIRDKKGTISFVFANDAFGAEFAKSNGKATAAEALQSLVS